jgi:hypothetical protein
MHVRSVLHPSVAVATHSWHFVAAAGGERSAPPQVSPHSVSHLDAMQIDSGANVGSARTGLSTLHCERHWGSPLHAPAQDWNALHAELASQALDSLQQLDCTHAAQLAVP